MSRYHRQQHLVRHRKLVAAKQAKSLLIDKLVYVAAISEPLITAPQAYTIFRTHHAANVSILTWTGFELFTFIWLWYGIAHHVRAIWVYQSLFAIFQAAVIVGAIIYGGVL